MAEMCGFLTLIGDDFDTALVTKRLGRAPSEVREKTEILRNGSLFGHCEWGVQTEMIDSYWLPPVCQQLRNLLPMGTEALRQVAEDCGARWHILFQIDVGSDFPALYMDPDFIRFVSEINGCIDFDVGILNDLGHIAPMGTMLREQKPTKAELRRLHERIAGQSTPSDEIQTALMSIFLGKEHSDGSASDC